MPKKKQKKLDRWQKGYVRALRDQIDEMRNFLGDLDDSLADENGDSVATVAVITAATLSEQLMYLSEGGQ